MSNYMSYIRERVMKLRKIKPGKNPDKQFRNFLKTSLDINLGTFSRFFYVAKDC